MRHHDVEPPSHSGGGHFLRSLGSVRIFSRVTKQTDKNSSSSPPLSPVTSLSSSPVSSAKGDDRLNRRLSGPEFFGYAVLPDNFIGAPFSSLLLLLLLCVALTPLFTMVIMVTSLRTACNAMFVMHFFCMSSLPLVVVYFITNDAPYYKSMFKSQIKTQWRHQLGWALVLCVYGCLTSILIHDFVLVPWRTNSPSHNISRIHQYIARESELVSPYFIFMGFWIIVLNPVFEEFFWRVFLTKEIGARFFPMKAGPSHVESCVAGDQTLILDLKTDSRSGPSRAIYQDVKVSLLGHALVSVLYTSYHVVIVTKCTRDPLISLLGCSSLCLYGMIFSYLRTHQRFGVICSYAVHVGVDLAIVINFYRDVRAGKMESLTV